MTETVIINGKPHPIKQAVEMLLNTVTALQTQNGSLQEKIAQDNIEHDAAIADLKGKFKKTAINSTFDVSGTIPKFAGKADENVMFFLQKIEQAAVLTNWTPEVRLPVVRQFLTD
jgi:hypothetical protein